MPGVARVRDDGDPHPTAAGGEHLREVVVEDHPRGLEVDGAQGLVAAVGFVPGEVRYPRPVAGVGEDDAVTEAGAAHELA